MYSLRGLFTSGAIHFGGNGEERLCLAYRAHHTIK